MECPITVQFTEHGDCSAVRTCLETRLNINWSYLDTSDTSGSPKFLLKHFVGRRNTNDQTDIPGEHGERNSYALLLNRTIKFHQGCAINTPIFQKEERRGQVFLCYTEVSGDAVLHECAANRRNLPVLKDICDLYRPKIRPAKNHKPKSVSWVSKSRTVERTDQIQPSKENTSRLLDYQNHSSHAILFEIDKNIQVTDENKQQSYGSCPTEFASENPRPMSYQDTESADVQFTNIETIDAQPQKNYGSIPQNSELGAQTVITRQPGGAVQDKDKKDVSADRLRDLEARMRRHSAELQELKKYQQEQRKLQEEETTTCCNLC